MCKRTKKFHHHHHRKPHHRRLRNRQSGKKYLYRQEQLKIKLKWEKKKQKKSIHNSETHSLLSNSKLLPKSQWTLKCIHDDDLEFTTSKIIINAELSSMSITPDHPTTSQPVSSNTTTTIAIDHQHQHHRHRHSGPQCMPYALITTDRLAEQQNGQNKPPPPQQITINGRTTILTRWKQKLNKTKTATYSKLTNTTSLLRLCL